MANKIKPGDLFLNDSGVVRRAVEFEHGFLLFRQYELNTPDCYVAYCTEEALGKWGVLVTVVEALEAVPIMVDQDQETDRLIEEQTSARESSLRRLSDEDLIGELQRRGYNVTKS